MLVLGQDSVRQSDLIKHKIFIHLYPSALTVGYISFGFEHLYKKRLAQEFTANIKSWDDPIFYYRYNKGYRLNYLLKYNIYIGKIFRLSATFSLLYLDISYKDKIGPWLLQVERGPPEYTFLMDGQFKEYGYGLGFSFNFKIYKRLFFGSDLTLNLVKAKRYLMVKEQVSGPRYYSADPAHELPYTFSQDKFEGYPAMPYFTLKLSYLLYNK